MGQETTMIETNQMEGDIMEGGNKAGRCTSGL